MKNIFKKTLAAVSAAVLCAVPMTASFADAAAPQKDTYRVFFDQNRNLTKNSITFELGAHTKLAELKGINFNSAKGYAVALGGTGAPGYAKGVVKYTYYPRMLNNYNDKFILSATYTCKKGTGIEGIDAKCEPSLPLRETVLLIGDVNFDNEIDISDAILASRLGQSNPRVKSDNNQLRAADVDNDSYITSNDSDLICQYIARTITDFSDFNVIPLNKLSDYRPHIY